ESGWEKDGGGVRCSAASGRVMSATASAARSRLVNLNQLRVVSELDVGTEPRGCALTADGSLLYVANHTEGTVSIIDTSLPLRPVLSLNKVQVGGRPWAIAITDKPTGPNTVFVTDAFAELDPNLSDPPFDSNGFGIFDGNG